MSERFLAATFAVILILTLAFSFALHSARMSVSPFSISASLNAAASFLQKLFDPATGLCRETLIGELRNVTAANETVYSRYTNETYWIASDNYLDSLVLRPYNQTVSQIINQTCGTFYQGSYYPYQIMNGSFIPLTMHVPNVYVLANTSDWLIALNLHNGTVDDHTYLDYFSTGDGLVYETINYYVEGYPFEWCKGLYMEAYDMFDGVGVADSHFYNTGHYDNMKLALLVFGAKVLDLNVNLTGIETRLWQAQKTSGHELGGVTSVTSITGQPVGTANGETTAFTILAYDDTLIREIQSKRSQAMKQDAIDIVFSADSFNDTGSITNRLAQVPLLSNWTITMNSAIQWTLSSGRVAIGLFSTLAHSTNLSIQVVLYDDGKIDVVMHDAVHPNGQKIIDSYWSNPLSISLIANTLNVSSLGGINVVSFPDFRLAYVTAGSTEMHVCTGGDVRLHVVPEFPLVSILLLVFLAFALIAVATSTKSKEL